MRAVDGRRRAAPERGGDLEVPALPDPDELEPVPPPEIPEEPEAGEPPPAPSGTPETGAADAKFLLDYLIGPAGEAKRGREPGRRRGRR